MSVIYNFNFSILEGRRIVDINYLFTQIHQSRHDKFDCSFIDMEFKSELRKRYISMFTFECTMCGTISKISSENPNDTKYLGINQAVINGTLAIGTQFIFFNKNIGIQSILIYQ